MRSHMLPWLGSMRLRACLTLLALLASSTAQQGGLVVETETICGHDSTVIPFDSTVGGINVVISGIGDFTVEMERLGVFSIETGKPSLDIAEIMCLRGLCPVFLKGKNLDRLVGTNLDTKALMEEEGILPQNRAFCFFGVELPCSPVPNTITSESLMCSPPTLPTEYGIAPFGIFVLGPTLQAPGTLYLAEGLELNFYDSKKPPEPLRLDPAFSDFRDIPETVRVIGLNFGENSYGIYCMWILGGEEQEPVPGEFDAKEQLPGDDENEIVCPGPLQGRPAGEVGYLRISMTGPGEKWGGAGAAGTFSGAPPGAPEGTPYGVPLTFFDQGRKPLLYGHDLRPEVVPPSETYGDIRGGARLVLRGGNFAPLGDGLQCVFETPLRRVQESNVSLVWYNVSTTTATYLSPTSLACLSPPYNTTSYGAPFIGTTTVSVNTTYNSSLFGGPGLEVPPQNVPFTYYDRTKPPVVESLHPSYAPMHGRALRLEGGWELVDHGHWEDYKGAEVTPPLNPTLALTPTPALTITLSPAASPHARACQVHGGVVLYGSNFVPSHFLWCAFAVPLAEASTRGAWRWTRGVYVNASAVRCEVPRGFLGDFRVTSSTDDMHYSYPNSSSMLTYYDPTSAARVAPDLRAQSRTQELPVARSQSGYLERRFLPKDDPLEDPLRVLHKSAPTPEDFAAGISHEAPFVHMIRGDNFFDSSLSSAELQAAPDSLLCRYGEVAVPQVPELIGENTTSGVDLIENIVEATFIDAHTVACVTPQRNPTAKYGYRDVGHTERLYVSTGGLNNFSDNFATVVYYDDKVLYRESSLTKVSVAVPSFGPIRAASMVRVSGTNFAPVSQEELKCVLNPSGRSVLDGYWSDVWHLLPAIFVDHETVLCNLSANLYETVRLATPPALTPRPSPLTPRPSPLTPHPSPPTSTQSR